MTSNLNSPYGGDKIHVNSYVKRDGTAVRAHERSRNNYWNYNNYYPSPFPNVYDSYSEQNLESKYKNKMWDDLKYDLEKQLVKHSPNFVINKYGEKFAKRYNLNDSLELFKVASSDYSYNPEYVQKSGKMYNSTSEIGDEKLAKKIKAQLFIEGTGMNDCRVFDMHENSPLSQKIAQSDEMKDMIKTGLPMLKYSGYLPAQTIEFKTPDLYNSIHRANISSAKFDDAGNLYVVLEDLYNFDKKSRSVRSMAGYKLQSQGVIKPYYIRTTVKIPKHQLDSL